MTLSAAVASLYLLFPLISPEHQWLADSLKKNPVRDKELAKTQIELINFFDSRMLLMEEKKSSENDDGLEIGSSGDELEQDGSSSSSMDKEDSAAPDVPEKKYDEFDIENVEKNLQPQKKDESLASVHFKNSMNHLRLFQFGEEELAVGKTSDSSNTITTINKDYVIRTSYDPLFRSAEKITWKNSSDVKSSKMVSKLKWSYDPYLSTVEEDYEGKTAVETIYDERKNPVQVTYFKYEPHPDSTKDNPVDDFRMKVKTSSKKFDESNRLVSDEEIFFQKLEGTTVVKSYYAKKNLFKYTEKSQTPDMEFYEDGKLRIKTEYVSDDEYSESIFFNDGFVVKSEYKDGIKASEKIYKSY